jgi:hypothetical protein
MAEVSPNHGLHVIKRATVEFREAKALRDAEEISEQIRLAEVLLDTLKHQEVHQGMGEHRVVKEEKKNHKKGDDFW